MEITERSLQLNTLLKPIKEAGYRITIESPELSALETLIQALAWCIFRLSSSSSNVECNIVMDANAILIALQKIECPFSIGEQDIEALDCEALFPVVQWLVERIKSEEDRNRTNIASLDPIYIQPGSNKEEAMFLVKQIEEKKSQIEKYKNKLRHAKVSLEEIRGNINEQDHEKARILSEMNQINEEVSNTDSFSNIENLVSVFREIKHLETKEANFHVHCKRVLVELEAQISDLDANAMAMEKGDYLLQLEGSLKSKLSKLEALQIVHANKCRAVSLLQRKVDDFPTQMEIIQFEHGFSELYDNIQTKLRETRRYYATYNALAEVKELMLKETSLLNSLCSQFENAMSSTSGRTKVLESMEAVALVIKQKFGKIEAVYQKEHSTCNSLKEKYARLLAENQK